MVNQRESWHLSKSVPITFIFAILMQTVALIWFVATLRGDVDANSAGLHRLEIRTQRVESVVQSQEVTLARMDENIEAIKNILEKFANER